MANIGKTAKALLNQIGHGILSGKPSLEVLKKPENEQGADTSSFRTSKDCQCFVCATKLCPGNRKVGADVMILWLEVHSFSQHQETPSNQAA